MKLTKLAYLIRNREHTIAIFGMARLVKNDAGRISLVGGSLDDRRAAREWCSHFLHEAAIDYGCSGSSHRNSPTAKAPEGPSERALASQLNPHNHLQAA